MRSLKDRLRSIPWTHRLARRALMSYRRWHWGLEHVHPTFYMARGCSVTKELIAHEHSFVNIGCILDSRVELGRYTMLAPHVAIVGGDHIFSRPGTPVIFSGRPSSLPATILEDDVWIGFGTIILAGLRIGRGAIVGAGSVVTRDIPPYEVHAGVPARKIGERFADPADRTKHDEMLSGPVITGEFCRPLSDWGAKSTKVL